MSTVADPPDNIISFHAADKATAEPLIKQEKWKHPVLSYSFSAIING